MNKGLWSIILFGVSHFSFATAAGDSCHPAINVAQANYVIGYGSLINHDSRVQTNPGIYALLPVKVAGFVRDWNAASDQYKIIYVGATPCDAQEKNCFLNGLAYLNENIQATDIREDIYCRKEVSVKNIQTYKKSDVLDVKAKYWLYVTKPEQISHPNAHAPLMQSYVDIFIGGCVEQAANIANKAIDDLVFPNDYGFAFDCVNGTKGWTTNFWLNDRVYPQRPWGESPYALKIDEMLVKSQQDGVIAGKTAYMKIPLEK